MEDLKLELDNLVRQLQRLQPAPDSTEAQTLRRLLDIRSLLEGGGHPAEKAAAFTALREFWLHRMAWC